MEESTFWSLIEQSLSESAGDRIAQREVLLGLLSRLPASDVVEFGQLYHDRMVESYRHDLWGAIWWINGGCSDDGFHDFRDFLIASGERLYRRTLDDPQSLLDDDLLDDGDWPYWEMHYASVAHEAYVAVLGLGPDHDLGMPLEIHWPDEPAGEPITEDLRQLKERLPRIYDHLDCDSWPDEPDEERSAPSEGKISLEELSDEDLLKSIFGE